MKKASILLTAFLGMVFFASQSFTSNPVNGPATAKVDTQNSSVQWKGYKVTGEHSGVVNIKSGQLTFDDNGMLNGGSFEIDMNTITCLDLQGGGKEKLEGHLKSDDFFGVATYPVAKFVATKVISRGKPGEFKVIGNLTIKETTKEVKFDTNLTEEGNKVSAIANLRIDRSDFDVRFGSGSFFDGLGDRTIYDEFDLTINLTANK